VSGGLGEDPGGGGKNLPKIPLSSIGTVSGGGDRKETGVISDKDNQDLRLQNLKGKKSGIHCGAIPLCSKPELGGRGGGRRGTTLRQ